MIEIGRLNELTILRSTSVGLYLGDEDEDVLLPNKYCPEEFEIGDSLEVFVYLDYAERKVASNLDPKIHLNEFGFLQVQDVSNIGAFMDWGLEKDLLVPFREQRQKMQEDRWYIVYLDIDKKSNRLFASNKVDKYLSNEILTVEEGEEVDLMVLQHTDIGYSVIVNDLHKGLIYENEVFTALNVGDRLTGFIKAIREDSKLDISLSPTGYEKFNDVNCQLVMDELDNEDFLPYHDKSNPEEIYSKFGISKKAFKKAIGALYKSKLIDISSSGISIIQPKN